MTIPRLSIGRLMAIVAIVAMDLAALVAMMPMIPNPGLAIVVVILEFGLFRAVDRRGRERAFWIGFGAFGWTYVLGHLAFDRAAWAYSRWFFESFLLRAKIGRPAELWAFIAFAGGFELVTAVGVGLIGGWLAVAFLMEIADARAPGPPEESPAGEIPPADDPS